MGVPVRVDRQFLLMAFGRDLMHDGYPHSYYLDTRTGLIARIFDSDRHAQAEGVPARDNADDRARVHGSPDRFIELPGRTHGEQHEILRAFISSEWTKDEELRSEAQGYFGSIGGWKKQVPPDVWHAFEHFRDEELCRRAIEYLRQRGVEIAV